MIFKPQTTTQLDPRILSKDGSYMANYVLIPKHNDPASHALRRWYSVNYAKNKVEHIVEVLKRINTFDNDIWYIMIEHSIISYYSLFTFDDNKNMSDLLTNEIVKNNEINDIHCKIIKPLRHKIAHADLQTQGGSAVEGTRAIGIYARDKNQNGHLLYPTVGRV